MLREDLGETVRFFNRPGHLGSLVMLDIAQAGGIDNVRTHTELLCSFLGDCQGIAGHHLDLHTHGKRRGDGGLGIFARRVEQGQHPQKPPAAVPLGPRYAYRTETALCELTHRLFNLGLYLPGFDRYLQDHLRRTLGDLELLAVFGLDGGLGALMYRIEGLKVNHLEIL